MSWLGIYGNYRRHLVLAIGGKPHLVVGDVPGLDAEHAAPGTSCTLSNGDVEPAVMA